MTEEKQYNWHPPHLQIKNQTVIVNDAGSIIARDTHGNFYEWDGYDYVKLKWSHEK
jgi:hypothetical protein